MTNISLINSFVRSVLTQQAAAKKQQGVVCGTSDTPSCTEVSRKSAAHTKVTFWPDLRYKIVSRFALPAFTVPTPEQYTERTGQKPIHGFETLENGVTTNLTELIIKAGLDPSGWVNGLEKLSWEVLTAYMLGLEFNAKKGDLDGVLKYKGQNIDMNKFNAAVADVKGSNLNPKTNKPIERPYDADKYAKWAYRRYCFLRPLGRLDPLPVSVPSKMMDPNYVMKNLVAAKKEQPAPPKPDPKPADPPKKPDPPEQPAPPSSRPRVRKPKAKDSEPSGPPDRRGRRVQ